ncbi:MAG: hypothetical protein J7527_16015, partial [Chitinophagaceae bacterium]|nr:hypothetical protein [Chitinophagaceae bacterium]
MRKSWYYLLFLLIVVSACGKHSTKPEKLLQVFAESLATATAMQSQQLELVELRIREMAKNPAIGEIARRIEARIKRITILTNAAQQQIKNLREQLTREQQANRKTTVSPDWTDKASLLYTQLALFRDSVLNADWALKTEFGSNFPLLGTALDSLINSDKELSEFLLNASYSTAFAWLSNVEFNLIHAGWKCATYCFESFAYDGGCDSG